MSRTTAWEKGDWYGKEFNEELFSSWRHPRQGPYLKRNGIVTELHGLTMGIDDNLFYAL